MNTSEIIFGGGRFWCTQAIFRQVRGVNNVESGYSRYVPGDGGAPDESVQGKSEGVRITYDPLQITLADIIRIHLRTHNPTTELGQYDDAGQQFRSVIFFSSEEERKIIVTIIAEMQSFYEHLIVTEILRSQPFEMASADDQDYYEKHTDAPYCRAVIDFKLQKFKTHFAGHLK
jgi:peptide methionine sulfoxide reductase msrA/msrB